MRLHDRETWPEARVTLLPFPWSWTLRPRWWRDVDMTMSFTFTWLCVRVEFLASKWGENFIDHGSPYPPPSKPWIVDEDALAETGLR